MGRKIYNRFEILKQVAGSPGNMVYKTQDLGPGGAVPASPADDSIVQLLEWTPEPGALPESARKLNDARDDVPEVEVFSSGASLYIASPSATAALRALGKLQSKGLFPGQWPGTDSAMSKEQWEKYWALQKDIRELQDSDRTLPMPLPMPLPVDENPGQAPASAVVVPPPPRPQPPPKPEPPTLQRQPEPTLRKNVAGPPRWLTPLIVILALLLAVGVGFALKERSRRIAEEQRQEQLEKARAQELEHQRLEQQRVLDEAKASSEKQQKDLEERMRQAEIQHQLDLANERREKEAAEDRLRQQQEKERRRIETAKVEKERQDQAGRERRRIEIANAQAAQKRKDDLAMQQEHDRIERQNAKAITDSFTQHQTALASGLANQYHRIRLINKCDSSTINVAIRFQSLDQTWVTQGWWTLDPHQEKPAPLVYSQNATFYFYAEGDGKVWAGDDPNALSIDIVENPFTHLLGPIVGKNKRVVKAIRRDFSTGFGEHPVPFNCQN